MLATMRNPGASDLEEVSRQAKLPVTVMPLDVDDDRSVADVFGKVGGALDVLVNDAGIFSINAVEDEGLEVWGGIDMSSLDEAFRGHAMLVVAIRRQGRELGQGRLSIGHFAEIEDGYRVGFVGLERWSEIDFSRRNYRRQMRWAFLIFLAGLLTVVVDRLAAWRRSESTI